MFSFFNTTKQPQLPGPEAAPKRPSRRLHQQSVIVNRRFVSAIDIADRVQRLSTVCAENFLDCCLEDAYVEEACREFARATGDPSLADPHAFASAVIESVDTPAADIG